MRNNERTDFMNVYDAIKARRTVRKFKQERVPQKNLEILVDCARMAAYGANMQPLKFRIITNDNELTELFPYIKWAGYLADGAPKEGERPCAYIAVLGDTSVKSNGAFETESGAAVTSMMLEAVEMGLATCWLGAINRAEIHNILSLSDNLQVTYLLAVGYPAQESRMVDMQGNDVKYYLDESGTVNVPKRSMEDILIK